MSCVILNISNPTMSLDNFPISIEMSHLVVQCVPLRCEDGHLKNKMPRFISGLFYKTIKIVNDDCK